jgi:hypothetical protein
VKRKVTTDEWGEFLVDREGADGGAGQAVRGEWYVDCSTLMRHNVQGNSSMMDWLSDMATLVWSNYYLYSILGREGTYMYEYIP